MQRVWRSNKELEVRSFCFEIVSIMMFNDQVNNFRVNKTLTIQ
jgi:hypothetical protein